jgi:CheY-like chemotaxis protein
MLTSLGQQFSPELLREHGIHACLSKPIRQSEFYNTLIRVLNDTGSQPLPSAPAVEPLQKIQPVKQSHPRVLLAEDNVVNQKVALKQLEKLGWEADVVSNGAEAVEAWRRCGHPIILMDCQMPEMDGYAATAQIREIQRSVGIPAPRIIAMTADAMKGDREKCLAAGMDDYLSKPVRISDLQNVLERKTGNLPEHSPPALQRSSLEREDRPGALEKGIA